MCTEEVNIERRLDTKEERKGSYKDRERKRRVYKEKKVKVILELQCKIKKKREDFSNEPHLFLRPAAKTYPTELPIEFNSTTTPFVLQLRSFARGHTASLTFELPIKTENIFRSRTQANCCPVKIAANSRNLFSPK